MRAIAGTRRIVYREMEKQTSLLSRGDQRRSVDGTTFVFSLERKIIIMTGGVGGRIALLCLGWMEGAVWMQYVWQSHEGRLGKWKVLYPLGSGEPLKALS